MRGNEKGRGRKGPPGSAVALWLALYLAILASLLALVSSVVAQQPPPDAGVQAEMERARRALAKGLSERAKGASDAERAPAAPGAAVDRQDDDLMERARRA
ncbi:MAG TPA: hypothetical protein VHN20_01760, partial [Beijerinckiaceae bacterium]|nr:hypothetical protein [Beijerinckiaceae bacterium]